MNAAIERIMAFAAAKQAEEEAKQATAAEQKRKRKAACAGYTRKYRQKQKALRDADPVLRREYLDKRSVYERELRRMKKEAA